MARGDPAVGLYEVVSGKVRQVRIDPEGRDIVVGIACAGDMIAEASLFSPLHDCCDCSDKGDGSSASKGRPACRI